MLEMLIDAINNTKVISILTIAFHAGPEFTFCGVPPK
jgi:hypothetical protein